VTDEETEQSALERIVGVMCRCGLTLDDPRVKQAVDELLAEFLDMLRILTPLCLGGPHDPRRRGSHRVYGLRTVAPVRPEARRASAHSGPTYHPGVVLGGVQAPCGGQGVGHGILVLPAGGGGDSDSARERRFGRAAMKTRHTIIGWALIDEETGELVSELPECRYTKRKRALSFHGLTARSFGCARPRKC